MSEVVHCDVCGKIFSSSHLKSHKRLAHKIASERKSAAPQNDRDRIQMIESLFNALPPKDKRKLAKRLAKHVSR